MFGKKKKTAVVEYDKENWKPVLKCSICNGEQVAGFQNIHTGEFREEILIKGVRELEAFQEKYGIAQIRKIY
ncbi:aspartate dehydrogenase [Parablautia muri]|uniref:Aspartate dehydrogenase n=1 Tax=Parablautia muri TaxID=2320879 RepID=A0A9X5BDD1_9FIRM|nr:aspartate dehydrogenase [Parablautia muri]NBJ91770.1 aspartate dehydrogenase [Parablautia muri]